MLRRVIGLAQTGSQQTVQSQHVQRGLHLVAVVGHGLGQSLRGVGRVVCAQVVGFVIEHPVAAFVLEHQIGKTHQHAVQLGIGQLRAAHTGQQVLLAQGIHLTRMQALGRQPKLHLRQQSPQRLERCVGSAQRLCHHTRQPLHHIVGLGLVACAFAAQFQPFGLLRVDGKVLGGQPFELVVQKIARAGAFGKGVPSRLCALVGACIQGCGG